MVMPRIRYSVARGASSAYCALQATPAQPLVRPVTPQELTNRTLVDIINSETGQVFAQLHRGEFASIGFEQPGHIVPQINLAAAYQPPRLARVSQMHGIVSFMHDGRVVYQDANSDNGSVVERRPSDILSAISGTVVPVPVLYFQILHNTITSYLVTNAISRAAAPHNPVGHVQPPDRVLLRSNDQIYLGFTYNLMVPQGIARMLGGGANHQLQPPAGVFQNGQLTVPRLAVRIS